MMIVSASYKTDIPAFYGDWFRARREAGFCLVQNVWNRRNFRVSLRDEDCSAFVFWTRNARPFRAELARTARTHPFVVQYTITGLPRWLEPSVSPPEPAAEDLRAIASEYGPDTAVWRYDPVVISDETPADWHRETFSRLADRLAGHVGEAVVSFAQAYRKSRRNLDRAAARHGRVWRDPAMQEKQMLASELAGLAAERGMALTVCAQADLAHFADGPARCIDTARLNRVAAALGHDAVTAPTKGPRPGCLCADARDIGAYDTCAHGCVYCYAVSDAAAARKHHRAHDAGAETLFPARASARGRPVRASVTR